jgi:hypothetical protein
MATQDAIDAFRVLIGNPPNEDPYLDSQLGARLDAASSPAVLAGTIWRERAASFASLVNVSESGSSRSLGDLYKNALAMATSFESQAADSGTGGSVRSVRVSKLSRS